MKTGRRLSLSSIIALMFAFPAPLSPASKGFPVSEVPSDVIDLLNRYLPVSAKSGSCEKAASELVRLDAAGHLVRADKTGCLRISPIAA